MEKKKTLALEITLFFTTSLNDFLEESVDTSSKQLNRKS